MKKSGLLKVLLAVFLISAVFILSGCSNGENDDRGVSGSVGGIVTDADTGRALEGVTVTIGNLTTQTNAKGIYAFASVPDGQRTIAGAMTGYENYSSKVDVFAGEVTRRDFAMTPGSSPEPTPPTPTPPAEDTGTVTGTVTSTIIVRKNVYNGDSRSLKPLEGVEVSIGDLSAVTDGEGNYTIPDVPSGAGQTITAKKDGFIDYTGTVDVIKDETARHDLSMGQFIQISAGEYITVALKSDGTVWAWGYNGDGQLGNGTTGGSSNLPVQVKGPGGEGFLTDIVEISTGNIHNLALKSDGTVWAWGYNGDGQLGNGNNTDSNLPVQVKDPEGTGFLTGVVGISGGCYHSLALKSDGTVWAWGQNSYGQLGNGTTGGTSNLPVQVKDPGGEGFLTDIVEISTRNIHNLALKSDGTVWAWGYNYYGQLGNGNNADINLPVQVEDPEGTGFLTGVVGIFAGGYHSLALKSDGTVWAWGANFNSQLGNGTTGGTSNLPVQVKDPEGTGFLTNITSISASYANSMAVRSDGTLWAWGYNSCGQLGNGTFGDGSNVPVQVLGPEGTGFLTDVISAAAGDYHSVALRSDGTVWAWGYNYYGQLGDGTTFYTFVPVQSLINLINSD